MSIMDATSARLEMLCQKVDQLAKQISKDHDTVLNHEGRITNLEGWREEHERMHRTTIDMKFAVFIVVLSAFLSALFTFMFTHLR